MRRNAMRLMVALGLIAAAAAAPKVHADDTAQNVSINKFVNNLKFSGDMRVRQENFWFPTAVDSTGKNVTSKDRSRQRLRLRWGVESKMDEFFVKFRMASGTGEQVSANQTFDNLFGQKQIWIDQAYLGYQPFPWLKVIGGKMENPLWRLYSSDIVWDADVNPEGFGEQLEYQLCERLGVFGNFGQFATKETGSDTRDPYLFVNQVGVKTKIMDETHFNVAFAYDKNQFENTQSLAPTVQQAGNNRFPGSSVSTITGNYLMYHVTAELATKVLSWPLDIQGDYVINNGDLHPELSKPSGLLNDSLPVAGQDIVGYQVGAILGKAKAAKTWEVAYFYKYSEFNSTLADLADSDFGNGGLNRKGHIFWAAYAPRDYLKISAKMFVTETLHAELSPGPQDINRFQLDATINF